MLNEKDDKDNEVKKETRVRVVSKKSGLTSHEPSPRVNMFHATGRQVGGSMV